MRGVGAAEAGSTPLSDNWFIAFVVDGAFIDTLPSAPEGFRRLHPDDLHLTLAFLARCGEQAARRGWAELTREAVPNWSSQSVSLGSVVPMGNPRHYSALSALLQTGREEVEARIASVRDAVTQAAGAPPETRKPKAHITLARPPRDAGSELRRAGVAWAESLQLGAIQLELSRVALYTRARSVGERLFEIVAQTELLTAKGKQQLR